MKTKVLLAICICVLLMSIGYGINYIYQSNLEREQISQLAQNDYENPKKTDVIIERQTEVDNVESVEESESVESKKIESTEEKLQILPKYEELYKENSDLVGWIKIEDTLINNPVMQTKIGENNNDPNFYIHRDWEKKESSHGLIYIDASCELDGKNIIIYGHRMKDNTMFGSLKYYKEEKYYKKHSIINFDTLYEEREYEIIGVCLAKVYYSGDTDEAVIKDDEFTFYKYAQINNENEFQEYIDYVKRNSLYKIDFDVQYEDELITLCTCDYYTKDGRLLVIAKRKK